MSERIESEPPGSCRSALKFCESAIG